MDERKERKKEEREKVPGRKLDAKEVKQHKNTNMKVVEQK